MAFEPTVTVAMRARPRTPLGETVIRYAAAYGCTLVAIAAAQLTIDNTLALGLAIVTLLGLPLSLWLRWTDLRFGRQRMSRFFLNSMVVMAALCASLLLLLVRLPIFEPHALLQALVRQGVPESVGLLMQVILIFAVSRCLAIISDKDAVMCAIPSFSVLLLLVVVHRGPEVVAYFLLWAALAAILFAVDHRAEARESVVGTVPSALPGQDVALSARSLTVVLALSLACAVTLSYTISARDPESRGAFESWIIQLAGRLTSAALDLPEVSVSSGPERQIDFLSGPALPSNTPLWRAKAVLAETGEAIRPQYWRMFTLTQYNGTSWTQSPGIGREVPRRRQTPDRRRQPEDPAPDRRPERASDGVQAERFYYYDVARSLDDWEQRVINRGATRSLVVQQMRPLVSMTGYLPALPVVESIALPSANPDLIRVRDDGAVDVQVLQGNQDIVLARSLVPSGKDYGIGADTAPVVISEQPNPAARLAPREREMYLEIYDARKLARVANLAREVVRRGDAQDSDYARARRLSMEIQRDAVYTLRPPVVPPGRDAADFFLFEGRRRGYCTYFASALTIMCRSVGIPARIVSGFAGAEWEHGEAVIREANAHAWTEVWVPNYGWATIDATPADDRGDNAPSWYENWSDVFSAGLATSWLWIKFRLLPVTMGLIVLIGVAFAVLAWRRGANWLPRSLMALLSTQSSVSDDAARRAVLDAYRRASRQLTRRFRHRAIWETPWEWTQAAESTLRLQDATPLRRLTELYMTARYSKAALGEAESEAAQEALRSLNWQKTE